MLFAFSMASCGVRKVMMASTGPKISSCAMRADGLTLEKKVGRKKSDPEAKFAKALIGTYAVGDIVDAASGDPFVRSGEEITEEAARAIAGSELREVEVLRDPEDFLILNTLREDTTNSHEEALLKIYQRLRPGNPPQIEKARELFNEKFFDETRYRLGRVGRFRLNRKFGTQTAETQQTLQAADFVQAIRYILGLRKGEQARRSAALTPARRAPSTQLSGCSDIGP